MRDNAGRRIIPKNGTRFSKKDRAPAECWTATAVQSRRIALDDGVRRSRPRHGAHGAPGKAIRNEKADFSWIAASSCGAPRDGGSDLIPRDPALGTWRFLHHTVAGRRPRTIVSTCTAPPKRGREKRRG